MTHTCQNCAHSQRGFFRQYLLICFIGKAKEVEADGCCEGWKGKENKD